MAPDAHSPLDQKILEHFAGNVVRKDLTTELKQNAVVPTYVLECLLGQHCATDDPALISDGLESVRRILAKHYVHRNQAELIQSTIKDKITVTARCQLRWRALCINKKLPDLIVAW
jgi:ATP-dependent Lon protease